MEGNDQSNPVALALKTLHRTIEKTRFDPEDAILDLEALVKVAKVYNHDKAREYECVLDEIQKHAKNLPQKSLRDLLVALVGDPVKSKVLEKTNKLLKHMQPDHKSSPPQVWRRFNTSQFGNPGTSRRSGAFNETRRSQAPYPAHRVRSSLCYFCGSSQHLLRNCIAFQNAKSAHPQNKP